ncbi:MAG: ribosomal protein S18-alanine N-acetyltransferase [Gammaproteobacteria bacterium]|nr:ribosomal protein S18-alanine N-acetyltransferase [Gammaproteobacteria bacterium]
MSAVLKSPPVFFRPMSGEDLDNIMTLETRNYDFPWTRQIFADCLRVGYLCQVCEMDNQLAGYCIMSTGASEAHVLNLCIAQGYRRRGLGKRLLTHMLELAKHRQVGTVFLEVRPSNKAAISLYEKMGFNEIGTRLDYYPARVGREDAIILAKSLEV